MDDSVDQPYNTPKNTSAMDHLQKQNAGIDSRYGVVSINPLHLGFDDLSSNPQEASACSRVPEQLKRIDAGRLSLNSMNVTNSMPAQPPDRLVRCVSIQNLFRNAVVRAPRSRTRRMFKTGAVLVSYASLPRKR